MKLLCWLFNTSVAGLGGRGVAWDKQQGFTTDANRRRPLPFRFLTTRLVDADAERHQVDMPIQRLAHAPLWLWDYCGTAVDECPTNVTWHWGPQTQGSWLWEYLELYDSDKAHHPPSDDSGQSLGWPGVVPMQDMSDEEALYAFASS